MTCKNVVYTLAGTPYVCGSTVMGAVIKCAEYPACTFSLKGTVTGRFSSSQPNRQELVPPDSCKGDPSEIKSFIDADYSKFENIMMTHYATVELGYCYDSCEFVLPYGLKLDSDSVDRAIVERYLHINDQCITYKGKLYQIEAREVEPI